MIDGKFRPVLGSVDFGHQAKRATVDTLAVHYVWD